MSYQLRKVVPALDYARIAEIMTCYADTVVDASQVAAMNRVHSEGDIRELVCAVDEQGRVLGFGALSHLARWSAGVFYAGVSVDPTQTRQGIGTALYEWVYTTFRGFGGTRLRGRVRDSSEAGLRFATQRGFAPTHRMFQSYLDVATFDETPFIEVFERVAAAGLRLSTVAAEGNTLESLRKMYEVDRIASLSLPDWEGDFPDFEQYADDLWDDPDFHPEAKYVAVDVQTGAFVGMAGLMIDAATNTMTHEFTAVQPAYQGQGIALALKLMTIRHAKAHGARLLYTHNHSANAPMLAINRKLGYQAMSGFSFFERTESH